MSIPDHDPSEIRQSFPAGVIGDALAATAVSASRNAMSDRSGFRDRLHFASIGWLPPSELALQAAQAGPLPDGTPTVVRSAIRIALDDLNERIATALGNAAEEAWRPSP